MKRSDIKIGEVYLFGLQPVIAISVSNHKGISIDICDAKDYTAATHSVVAQLLRPYTEEE